MDTESQNGGCWRFSGTLSVIIPVYNSQETVGTVVDRVVECLEHGVERLEVVLINDGSRDSSHEACLEARRRHPAAVVYLRLARNFGEHNAVLCGLRHCTGDAAAIIDDDMQNPPQEILKLVYALSEGHDVVYSRYARKHHSWFRNLGSSFNDRVATCLLRKPRGLYLSSFKAMTRFLIDTVVQYDGPYPYIDGLILRATDAIGAVDCEHAQRAAGRSNYTMRRLVRLWLNMFTNFSVIPLRLSAILGLVMSVFGLCLSGLFVFSWFFEGTVLGQPVPKGWASIIVSVTLLSGIQLCVLGMIGEYLGRLFLTRNGQPQSVVRERYTLEENGASAKQTDTEPRI